MWEEELEKVFMKLLYEMKNTKESVIADARVLINTHALTALEEKKLKELGRQIEAVSNRINQLATRRPSGNDAIYEATMRNLTYEQEILQMEYDKLNEERQEGIYIEKQLNELLKSLDEIQSEADDFRSDILEKVIEEGIVYQHQRIKFRFKCGIEREADARRVKK